MLQDITGNYILLGIGGIILILIVAFVSLLFLTSKKRPDQGVVSQVVSGISEARLIDSMPSAQPVEFVSPSPTATAPNTMPQAFNPTTGGSMIASSSQQQLMQNEILQKQSNMKPVIEDVAKKVEKLDKKIQGINEKLNISTK